MQPVKFVPQKWRHVVKLPSAVDSFDCVVQSRLNALHLTGWEARKKTVAIVYSGNHEAVEQLDGHRCRNRTSNCSNPSKLIERLAHKHIDVGWHIHRFVEVCAQVSDGWRWSSITVRQIYAMRCKWRAVVHHKNSDFDGFSFNRFDAIHWAMHEIIFDLKISLSDGTHDEYSWLLGDQFSGKPGKVREFFFKSGKSQGKQAKSGKIREIMIVPYWQHPLQIQIFTSRSTQNAHICIEVFKIFPRGHPRTPFSGEWIFHGGHLEPSLLEDEHLPRPHSSHLFTAQPRRYAPRLKAFNISFVHSQPYWKS